MTHALDYLTRQLEIAWRLTAYHLDGLTTEECLWRPAATGPHVHPDGGGGWRADWPEEEGYHLGPPSIGWLTWHVAFWWSMTLEHSFGSARLTREDVRWPGTADAIRGQIERFHDEWRRKLGVLTDAELRRVDRTRWPIRDRPFGEVVAWVNVELMKNAAEIGYARFLFATRPRS
ncbi:MAG: DinB family protein [Gemmatimonadales bacterium]